MVGVILAAGNGTRFNNSSGEECCKVLKKINGTPLIGFSLDNLATLGVDRVFIVVGRNKELVWNTIGREYRGIPITYVCQERQIGLANALICAIKTIGSSEEIILQLADEIFIGLNTSAIVSAMEAPEYGFFCGITNEDDLESVKQNYSVTLEGESIKRCIEKPTIVVNNIKGTGFCFFHHKALAALVKVYDEKTNIPYDLCDCVNYLLSIGISGDAVCVADKEFNINTMSDFYEAEAFFEKAL